MAEAELSICQMFLFLGALFKLFFKFPSNLYQRKRKMNGALTKVLFANKNSEWAFYLKEFEFGIKNAIFGYFSHILLRLESLMQKKTLNLVLNTYYLGILGQQF